MNIINEIGNTEKGQDVLGQVYGRAIARAAKLGDKGAVSRKLRNTARDAAHKAYSEAEKNNLFAGIGSSFDNGIDKGYHKAKTNESKTMNKKLIRLTESDLHKIVKESVEKILSESEIGDRVNALKGMSRTYKKDLTDNDNELSKTWNRGMGLQSFIEVLPDEGVILYNSLQTYNRDLERIKQVFPEYKLVKVDKPYYSHSSLRAHRNGTAIY